MGRYKFEELTARAQTACVGRFLVDLPAGMDVAYSHTFISGFWVSVIPESPAVFLQRVADREAQINAQPNELGKENMEKVQAVSDHGLSGKLFTFGRTSVEGLDAGRTVHYVNVALEGYVHGGDTTFVFKAEDVALDRTAILAAIIDKLRVVAPDEIPTTPGFCFGRGMLVDPVPAEWTEGVALFAGFRGAPDLALAFNTRAGLGKDPNDPGRLARNARSDAEMPLWQRPLLKKLRIGERAIAGIAGEEVLERGTELNSVQVYTFDWEAAGTKDDVLVPAMHLELSTGHPAAAGAEPVLSFLNEDVLVQLWDWISARIRLRPAHSVPATPPPPPAAQLGDSAAAGDICPETGWWRCADGRAGITVLGGQHQFMVKGQRMPQALFLPTPTLWERIQGVQPSYETRMPTAWTLTDRRSKARLAAGVQLAPAGRHPGRTGLGMGTGAAAPVGSFAATGTPCPASGWWRCHDADAYDGTRWFAKSELLPAATFGAAPRRFKLGSRQPEVFQRRSTWQLVRLVDTPTGGPAEDDGPSG